MGARFFNKQCRVSVEFVDGLSVKEVVKEISEHKMPHVVVWYIGAYGLRKAGAEFYREALINPVLKRNERATFWLVDLTAWSAFKSGKCSIHKASCCCEAIDKLSNHQVRCIRTGELFKKMQAISERSSIDYFKEALRRDFIHQASKEFPDKNIRVREIFEDGCPIMEEWYDHDVGKCYAVFQYLEGCLLIEELFKQMMSKELQVVFALPNDEQKYYWDEKGSFQQDVQFLIGKQCEKLGLNGVDVNVQFLSFRYGMKRHQRPYNAPGKVIKKRELSHRDIVGHIHRGNHRSRISFHLEGHHLRVEIETKRLHIHSCKAEDFEECLSLYGNPDITQYFDHGQPRSKTEVLNLVQMKGMKYFRRGRPFGLFSIFCKKSKAFMGQIDLVPTGEAGAAEMGFILNDKFQNQGYCAEAVRALLFDYINELNYRGYKIKNAPITKVIATVHPENEPSKRLIEKVGMSFDRVQDRFGNPRLWYSYIPESAFFVKMKKGVL